jgi:hypothetical protein
MESQLACEKVMNGSKPELEESYSLVMVSLSICHRLARPLGLCQKRLRTEPLTSIHSPP